MLLNRCTVLNRADQPAEGRGAVIHVHGVFDRNPSMGRRQVQKVVRMVSESNFNFLTVWAKHLDTAMYTSKILPAPHFIGWNPLREIVEAAHQWHLEVHAVVSVFPKARSPDDLGLLRDKPEWAMVNERGERVEYSDPAKDEVRDYELSIIDEIVRNYEVDGIQLDYCRYPSAAAARGRTCYCDHCRSTFKDEFGVDPLSIRPNDPLEGKWDEWRKEMITSFVGEAHRRVHKIRPKATLSAYCWGPEAAKTVFQDWPEWVRRGYVDWIGPSGYVYDIHTFRERCVEALNLIKGGCPMYYWVGITTSHGKLETVEEAIQQINVAREAGANGVALRPWSTLQPWLKDISKACFRVKAALPHRT